MRTLKEFRGIVDGSENIRWEVDQSCLGKYRFWINAKIEKESDDLSMIMHYLADAIQTFVKYEDSKTLRIEGVDHEKKSA